MEKEAIIKYIENPHELNEYSFSELRALLKKYPYFQTAHQLLLLNLKNINDPRFKEFLKQSAVYIKDREKFHRLINDLSAAKDSLIDKEKTADTSDVKAGDAEEKQASGARNKPVNDTNQGKEVKPNKVREKFRKDKDFSTAYLKQRISNTLSVQKEDGDKKDDLPDDSGDFFILDKASQVEEKMSQKFKEKYEKANREGKGEEQGNGSSVAPDSFELDGAEQRDKQKSKRIKKPGDLTGEYFTDQDYRKTVQNKEHNEDLIDKFIKESPELKSAHPPENKEKKEDISLPSIKENEEMLSEKLANIYIKQGYYNKAISAYQKLSLKYPQKSDYFAEQIEKLRNIINEQQK